MIVLPISSDPSPLGTSSITRDPTPHPHIPELPTPSSSPADTGINTLILLCDISQAATGLLSARRLAYTTDCIDARMLGCLGS